MELPAVLRLLVLDLGLDLLSGIVMAGILHAVGGDDEQGVLRHVLGPGVAVDVPDVVDGPADGVQQRRAAPDEI